MNVVAYTKLDSIYPGFINFTPNADGGVTVHLRGDPNTINGVHVCSNASDRGKHGRCTPGDENCNNYCNMAPEKGAMQDHPKPCKVTREGSCASMVLSADEWRSLREQLALQEG